MLERVRAVLRTAFRNFAKAERGNVAMMFAATAVPLTLAAGGGVDYARAIMVRSEMQDALDATALALSKSAPTMTQSEMDTKALNYFDANFDNADAHDLTVTPSYQTRPTQVTVSGTANVDMYFMGLIGIKQLPIEASSTVTWGSTLLRVALVLDNTGSMADDGKMSALKTATHNLLQQLEDSVTDSGDIYVSIVPFSKDVNVGSSEYNESWIDWTDWEQQNGTMEYTNCSGNSGGSGRYGYHYGGYGGYGDGSYGYGGYGYSNRNNCDRTWVPDDHNTWNGCITDRTQDYDTLNTAPTSGDTLFPAEQYSYCPSEMTGLTEDWGALSDIVDSMYPNGNTNQAIGLAWGWQSLTESPFTIPPYDAEKDYTKVIVILTDGLNTEDRWYTHASQIDAREEQVCDNIKADGTLIYAVQVNTGGDPTSTLLQNCASDSDKFFLLTNSSQIIGAFESIGTDLSNLRISG